MTAREGETASPADHQWALLEPGVASLADLAALAGDGGLLGPLRNGTAPKALEQLLARATQDNTESLRSAETEAGLSCEMGGKPTLNSDKAESMAREFLFGNTANVWKLVRLAKAAPEAGVTAILCAVGDTLDCMETHEGGWTILRGMMLAAGLIELAQSSRPSALGAALDTILGTPKGRQLAPGVLVCAALMPAAASACGEPLLRCMLQALSSNKLPLECPAEFLQELGCPTDGEQSKPEGVSLWVRLLLAQHLGTWGWPSLAALSIGASGVPDSSLAGRCRATFSWIEHMAKLGLLQGGSSSSDGPQDLTLPAPLFQQVQQLVQHLEAKMDDMCKLILKETQQSQLHEPLEAHCLFSLLGVVVWAGVPTTGCSALAALSAAPEGQRSVAVSYGLSLAETLCAGGAGSEVRLWLRQSIETARRSPSLHKAYLCGFLEGSVAGGEKAEEARLPFPCLRVTVLDSIKQYWPDLCELLLSDEPEQVLSLLQRLRPALRMSENWWDVQRSAVALLAHLLGLIDEREMDRGQVGSAQALLVDIAISSEKAFHQVFELVLDSLLGSALLAPSTDLRTSEVLGVCPALVLGNDGCFTAAAATGLSADALTEPAMKRPRHNLGAGLLWEARSLKWAQGMYVPEEHRKVLKANQNHAGSAKAPEDEAYLSRLRQLRSTHIVETLRRCISTPTSSQSADLRQHTSVADRAVAAAIILSKRLEDGFGQPPGPSLYDEFLPRRPSSSWHLKTVELLRLCPDLMEVVVAVSQHGGAAALKPCQPLLRSQLAERIAKSAVLTQAHQDSVVPGTTEVVRALQLSGGIPDGLADAVYRFSDSLPLEDLSLLLMAVWRTAHQNPEGLGMRRQGSYSQGTSDGPAGSTGQGASKRDNEWHPLVKSLLHKHCVVVGRHYGISARLSAGMSS